MPSPKTPTDPDFSRFDFRPKVNKFPVWKGVAKDGDDSTGPTNQIREGLNIRSDGEGYICRGGLSKAVVAPATGKLDGIWEAGDIGANVVASTTHIPLNALLVAGYAAETGFGDFVHINTSSVVSTTSIAAGIPVGGSCVDYAGVQFGGVNISPEGKVVNSTDQTILFTVPRTGSTATIQSAVVIGSNLYVSWTDDVAGPNVNHNISRWNGTTLSLELQITDALSYDLILGVFSSTPYAAVQANNSGVNLLYQRTGVATWTSTAFTGATSFRAHSLIEFGGKLYIMGADDTAGLDVFRIYSTVGAATTLERTIATGLASHVIPSIISQLGVIGTNLYYWYHDGGSGATFSKIGLYNGVFADTHKNLATDIGAGYGKGIGFVAGTDGADAVYLNATTFALDIWEGPGTNLAGTWTKVLSTTPPNITVLGTLFPPVHLNAMAT